MKDAPQAGPTLPAWWRGAVTVAARTVASLARRPRLVVASAMCLSTLAVWIPFLRTPEVLYRYWDGPHYAYLAQTLHDVPASHPFTAYHLTPAYFACHLPAYPLLIRTMTLATGGHYMPAMLLATLLCSVASALLFYEVLRRNDWVASPLWTAVLFAWLPLRWVIYHSVGASEPLFLVFVMAAFLAYKSGRVELLTLAIAGASLTRIVGVLMVPAFVVTYLAERQVKKALVVPLAGLAVLALFTWHFFRYGDFFAYFSWNVGKEGLVSAVPLRAASAYAGAGDVHSTELYLGLYAVFAVGTAAVWRHRVIFWHCLAYLSFSFFFFHFDLSRTLIPAAPFALLVAFDGALSRPACRIGLPLLVWLDLTYAWGLIPHNAVVPAVYEGLCRVLRC